LSVHRSYFLILALAAMLLAGCDKSETPEQRTPQQTARTPAGASDGVIGIHRPEFSLPDLEGRKRVISEWDGKVLVINFWATWCPPCRKELPAFVQLQEKYARRGLQFIGVAIDEKDKVIDFTDTFGVNYPILVGDLEAIDISKAYGNRFGALPYTVITDRNGTIVFVQRGELLQEVAEKTILPLLGDI
jgi:thiol-disulfide isomerase/thioredoxin